MKLLDAHEREELTAAGRELVEGLREWAANGGRVEQSGDVEVEPVKLSAAADYIERFLPVATFEDVRLLEVAVQNVFGPESFTIPGASAAGEP